MDKWDTRFRGQVREGLVRRTEVRIPQWVLERDHRQKVPDWRAHINFWRAELSKDRHGLFQLPQTWRRAQQLQMWTDYFSRRCNSDQETLVVGKQHWRNQEYHSWHGERKRNEKHWQKWQQRGSDHADGVALWRYNCFDSLTSSRRYCLRRRARSSSSCSSDSRRPWRGRGRSGRRNKWGSGRSIRSNRERCRNRRRTKWRGSWPCWRSYCSSQIRWRPRGTRGHRSSG